MRGVLQHIGLRRRVSITVPVAMLQVRENLSQALQNTIILSGQWQLTRRYWGHLSQQHLTLHGPKAHRQFCFLTQGYLSQGETPAQTHLELEIVLGRASEMQLLWGIGVLVLMLGVVLQLFGLLLLPLFLSFFYGMTQWHFAYYTAEITQLLRNQMLKTTQG